MYKMLAIDLDDTTLDKNNKISKENIKAIKDCEKAGIRVVFATGRSENSSRKFAKALGLENNKHVLINGALILDMNKGNTLIKTISRENVAYLKEKLRSENRQFIFYSDTGKLIYEYAPDLRVPVKFYHGKNNVIKGNIDEVKNPYRICTYYKDEKELIYLRSICPKDMYTTAFPPILDYLPSGINKYSGIEYLLKYYNVKKEELIAIGDQESDMDILKNAGLSFAVKNCDDFAREAADIVLEKTNNESAVAEMVYKYILK